MNRLRCWCALAVGLSLFSASAGVYREDAFNRGRAARLKDEVPAQVRAWETRLAETREKLTATFANVDASHYRRERVFRRLAVAEDLLTFVRRTFAQGDVSSVLFAEHGLEDLTEFDRYFAAERECWPQSPENPSVVAERLSAADFGLVGDGKTDNMPAFRRAMDAVRTRKGRPTVLTVPAGDYLFDPPTNSPLRKVGDVLAQVRGISNLLIAGEGPDKVRFVAGYERMSAFNFLDCRNCVLRGVEISWRDAVHCEGRVTAFDAKTASADIVVNPEGLRPDYPLYRTYNAQVTSQFDDEGRLVFGPTYQFFDPKHPPMDLGGGNWRIFFSTNFPGSTYAKLQVGKNLVIPCRGGYICAATSVRGTFNSFVDVWVRNSPTLAFSGGDYTSVVRCRVFPKKGFSLSTNADGFISSRSTYFADCDFRNMLDDGHNPHSYGGYVADSTPTGLVYKSRHTFLFPADDRLLLLVRAETGEFLGNIRSRGPSATCVWGDEGGYTRTVFEALPPDVRTYVSLGCGAVSCERQKEIVMGRAKGMPLPDQIYHPNLEGVGDITLRCRIASLRGGCFSIQASNALIEDTTLVNVPSGIRINCLTQWTEGPAPYHVTVRNCRLEGLYAAVSTAMRLPSHGTPQTAPIRGILFDGLDVRSCEEGFSFRNADDVTLRRIKMTDVRKPWFSETCGAIRCDDGSFHVPSIVQK